MLDFLGKVPDVGWAALITGVVTAATLMAQTFLTNRRDDRRRTEDATERQQDRVFQAGQAEAERAHRAEMAREERVAREAEAKEARLQELQLAEISQRAAREDAWRDERRQVHARLISVLEECNKQFGKAVPQASDQTKDRFFRSPDGVALDVPGDALSEELAAALAIVQLVGSDRSRVAASKACNIVHFMSAKIWLATYKDGSDMDWSKIGEMRQSIAACEQELGSYIDAARADLGTTE